jgi:APA family basic amino acid/polyamine antiporter
VNPAFAGPVFVVAVAIGSIILFTAVNALGVRAAGGLSLVTVAIKLLPLAAVILILLIRGAGPSPYEPLAPAPLSLANVATAAALTFYALTGFESATTPVDKVREPSRTIPIAIFGGTLFVAVAAFGCLNGLILATGELGYSMALRRDLPAFMARTRGENTPVWAQVVGSALTILLILANSSRATSSLFTFIILLSTASVLVVYLAGAVSAWRLGSSAGERLAVVGALLFILFAFYGAGAEANLWCLVLLAVGLAVRAVMHRVMLHPS